MHDDMKAEFSGFVDFSIFSRETQNEKLWETLLLRWWEYVKM